MIFAESCWRRNCWWLNRYKESIFQEKLLKFSIICLPNRFLLSFYSRYSRCFITKTFRNKWLLEIRKSQDLAKDLGGTASKAEKKICQSKIVSYIQKHNKTVIPKMKTKWKEKEKKEEKKRKEAKRKRYCPGANSGPSVHRAKALPLGHVEHTRHFTEFLLFKPLSLIKHEFKDIFHKNDCSLDSENPR